MVAGLVLVAILVLFLLLLATDTALSVWQRLTAAPAWVRYAWIAGVSVVTLAATALAWRWLQPRKPSADATAESASPTAPDPEHLARDLERSGAVGVDVAPALAELEEQRRRKAAGEVYIAVFGEVSTGKSSLVRALLPDADAPADPRAGTTATVRHYRWRAPSGDRVVIADLPGFNLQLDPEILAEARRAHLVVFLVDGDLARSQHEELARLRDLDKPLLLAVNKVDRFNEVERDALRDRLAEQTGLAPREIVLIRTGGREEVVRLLADGGEERTERERGSNVEPLRRAIQAKLDEDGALMEDLRDTALLLLAAERFEVARDAHRAEQADALVRTYSKRAVIGALAAVAPGSDLVIQGVLATRLIQELCAIYDVSVKEVQIESFLKLAGGRVRKMSALTLAISGNALKSFPGLGTLSGGLLHAVAYGMIFDSLGRAAADTLASRGELRPLPAARAFEENMGDSLESSAKRFARLALAERRRQAP